MRVFGVIGVIVFIDVIYTNITTVLIVSIMIAKVLTHITCHFNP